MRGYSPYSLSAAMPKFGERLAKLISQSGLVKSQRSEPSRDVVAVLVDPRQRRGLRQQRVVVGRDAGGARQVVAVERVLQRGPAVAEQVVDQAQARREVVPVRQVLDFRRTCAPARTGRPATRPRSPGIQRFPADADVRGQAVEAPRVLDVEAQVAIEMLAVDERRVADRARVSGTDQRHAGASCCGTAGSGRRWQSRVCMNVPQRLLAPNLMVCAPVT